MSSQFWPESGTSDKTSVAFWTPQAFTGAMEVSAKAAGSPDVSEGWRIGFLKDVGGSNQVDGYLLMINNGIGSGGNWQVRRYANGSSQTIFSQNNLGLPGNKLVLFRRVGGTLEAWESGDNGANWTLKLSVSDSTYTTDLRLALAIDSDDGTGPTWDDFGGGGDVAQTSADQTIGSCGPGTHANTAAACQDDPVHSLTGAFTTSTTDLRLPGIGVPFRWARTYTSSDTISGRLGPGWTDSYATSLLIQGNGDVILRGDEGQRIYYTKQGSTFVGAAGALSTLASIAGGYELTRRDQVVYRFDTQGRLTSMKDRNAQGLTFAYDGSGQLQTITDSVGRQIAATYAAGLLSRVTLPDARYVEYSYTSGRLSSVRDVRGGLTQYTYDAGGRLKAIVDQNANTVVDNTYGTDGRVTQQVNARGKTGTFSWNPTTQTQTYTDARLNQWKDVYAN